MSKKISELDSRQHLKSSRPRTVPVPTQSGPTINSKATSGSRLDQSSRTVRFSIDKEEAKPQFLKLENDCRIALNECERIIQVSRL